jgi:hypothetical protein
MNRLALLALLLTGSGFAQDIHFKTRTITPRPAASGVPLLTGNQMLTGHEIVQFDHSPGVADLDSLLKAGLRIVGALPDNAVVVSGSGDAGGVGADTGTGANSVTGVKWTGPLDPADKLSPSLGAGDPILAILEFHADVSQSVQDSIAVTEGLTLLRPSVLVANHAIVSTSLDELKTLANYDEVAYIFPADPALLTGGNYMPCAGMLTQSGPVAQYANIVHGWDLDADNAAHLSYVFGSLTPKAPVATVQSEIIRALNEWSKNANVIFAAGTDPNAPRTVVVKFVSGAHGDAYPFEGYGAILAHTFYPVPVNPESIAGDMHLNADENWHVGSDIDIYSVALHEAGHAIGLGHTDNPGDVMYPYYHSAVVAPVTAPVTTPVTGGTGTPAVPPPTPLQLTIDPVPASTQAAQLTLTGILSGGTGPFSVQWQTDHGYSGQASLAGSGAWSGSGVSLVNGTNTLTVTAFDSAHQTATQTASVALAQPPATTSPNGSSAPISVAITSPASAVITVSAASISVAGKAAGGAGIARVTWQTSTGSTGVATGTGQWLASNIPLLTGTTTIVIRAWDINNASAWAAVVAVK